MAFTRKQILDCWNKAQRCRFKNLKLSVDTCGAVIQWEEYGNQNSPFGWQIDHIFPEATLKAYNVPQELIDHPLNLIPLHWENNLSKSNNYPVFRAKYSDGILDGERVFSKEVQQIIENLYGNYLPEMTSGNMNT